MAEGNPETNPATDAGATPSPADIGTALGGLWTEPLSWLVLALPVAVVLELLHAAELWIFMVSALAIVPLAGLMGRATENLAETLGAGVGGLLNATFGNAAELIIGLMALWKGPAMYPLVKASITGSIIGNILLVLGMAILVGGLYDPWQVQPHRSRYGGHTVSPGVLWADRADPVLSPAAHRRWPECRGIAQH